VTVTPIRPQKARVDATQVNIHTAADLEYKEFDALKEPIPGFLCEGLWLVAAPPKAKKTFLLTQAAIAIANGAEFCGYQTNPGAVLFLAYEDSQRRMKWRVAKCLKPGQAWPENFHFATRWPRDGSGGVEQIEKWLIENPHAQIVVVDILQRFRKPSSGNNAYKSDYESLESLQRLALKYRIAIVVIHHTRKSTGSDNDPGEDISGTMGLAAACNGYIVLRRLGKDATLYCRHHEYPDRELAASFDEDACQWMISGLASEFRAEGTRAKIIEVLLEEPAKPCSAATIAGLTEINKSLVTRTLARLVQDGQARREGRGLYLPSESLLAAGGPSPLSDCPKPVQPITPTRKKLSDNISDSPDFVSDVRIGENVDFRTDNTVSESLSELQPIETPHEIATSDNRTEIPPPSSANMDIPLRVGSKEAIEADIVIEKHGKRQPAPWRTGRRKTDYIRIRPINNTPTHVYLSISKSYLAQADMAAVPYVAYAAERIGEEVRLTVTPTDATDPNRHTMLYGVPPAGARLQLLKRAAELHDDISPAELTATVSPKKLEITIPASFLKAT
jgi:hypothetical protein